MLLANGYQFPTIPTLIGFFNYCDRLVTEQNPPSLMDILGVDREKAEKFMAAQAWTDLEIMTEITHPTFPEMISGTCPDDLLRVDRALFARFDDILRQAGSWDDPGVPSDLADAWTIPMEDVVIEFNLGKDFEGSCFRVQAIDGCINVIAEDGQDPKCVLVWPLEKLEEEGRILLSLDRVFAFEGSVGHRLLGMARKDGGLLYTIYVYLDTCLKIWYAFEICLLNPEFKEVLLKKDGKEKLAGRCCTGKKDGRKAKYVKVHNVSSDIFDTSAKHGIERKTMCWYVIGHWREYSNGKRTFVKPHWKGPLRHMERNLDGLRERSV